jgi:hypothetical protein
VISARVAALNSEVSSAAARVDSCEAELGSPEGGYTVTFTQHPGNEIFRDGKFSQDWQANEGDKP